MRENYLGAAIKGLLVGGTMLVPGVSGGSMAMVLGIYDRLIGAVSSFGRDKKRNFLFLAAFGAGALCGMAAFARPVLFLLKAYPLPVSYFFLGAVAGGIPLMIRKSRVSRFSWRLPAYVLLGGALVWLLSRLPQHMFSLPWRGGAQSGTAGILWGFALAAAGAVAAVALVLPGISVSYLFLMMGLYDTLMEALTRLYLPFLLPLGIGLLAGILATARLLETALRKYSQQTYFLILGFILASLGEVFPGLPTWRELPLCALTLTVGIFFIRYLPGEEGGSDK